MAVRIVGALGIKVRPDTTKFNEELRAELAKSSREEVRIPVAPNDDLFRKRVEKTVKETTADLLARGIAVKVPVKIGKDDLLEEAKKAIDEANAKLKGKKLSVGIGVDSSDLARQLDDALHKAEAELHKAGALKIKVQVQLDTEKAKQDLNHFVRNESGKKIDLKADIDRQNTVRAQLAALTRNRDVSLVVKIQKRSIATAKATLASLFGADVFRKVGESLDHFVSNIASNSLRFATTASKVATIASAVLASTSAITGVMGSLGQLGGFVAGLPAATGAIAAFVLVNIAAFKNFKSAVDGNVNAMAQLPANARGAAQAMHGVWSQMQRPIQDAYWAKMGGVFEDLVGKTIPEVRKGLVEVAGSAGNFSQQIIRAFSEQGGTGLFANMFHQMAVGLQNANQGARPFIGAVIQLGKAGSQFLPAVGKYLGDAGQTFDAWVRRSSDSGRITGWMHNASVQAHNLGQVFVNTKGIFSALMDGARGGGAGDLKTFSDFLGNVRNTLQGSAFQDTIRTLFSGAHDAIGKVRGSFQDLFVLLHDQAPMLKGVLESTGATVATLISGVSRALNTKQFGTGMTDLFTGLNLGVQGLVRYLPGVAGGLGALGTVMGKLIQNLLPNVGQILSGVGDFFVAIKPAMEDLIPVVSTFSTGTVGILIAALTPLSVLINGLTSAFTAMPGFVQTALLSLLLLKKLGGVTAVLAPFKKAVTGITTVFKGPSASDTAKSVDKVTKGGLSGNTTQHITVHVFVNLIYTAAGNPAAAASRFMTPYLTAIERFGTVFPTRVQTVFRNGMASATRSIQNVTTPFASGFARQLGSSLSTPATQAAVSDPMRRIVNNTGRVVVDEARRSWNGSQMVGAMARGAEQGAGGFASRMGGIFRGIASGGTNAMKGLFSFIGGGWGVAFIAGFAILQKMSTNTAELKKVADDATLAYQNMAKAAGDAGQRIGDPASLKAAQDYLDTVKLMSASVKTNPTESKLVPGVLGAPGFTFTKSLEQIVNDAGFSDNDIVAVMNGKGSDSAKAFLKSLQTQLGNDQGNWFTQIFKGNDTAKMKEVVDGIITDGGNAQKALDDLWKSDGNKGQLITAALQAIQTETSSPVTIDNINTLKGTLDHLSNDGGSNLNTFAHTVAEKLGGTTLEVDRNFGVIANTLNQYDAKTGLIAGQKPFEKIAQDLLSIGVPASKIKGAMEELGYSTEDAANAMTFQFGAATNSTGQMLTVLGKHVPLIKQFSGGLVEMSNALSAASGVDAGKLKNAISLGGYDPTKLAVGLAAQGVAVSDIATVLQDLGVKGDPAAKALDAAATALSKFKASGAVDLRPFQSAMDDIAKSADNAATKADALYAAIQQLEGNPLDHWKVENNGSKAIESAKTAFHDLKLELAKKQNINLLDGTGIELTGQKLEEALSKVQLSAKDVGDALNGVGPYADTLGQTFEDLGRNQLAVAKDAFDGVIKRGGSMGDAMTAAMNSTKPFQTEVESLITQLHLTKQQGDQVRQTFGLIPKQTVASVTASVGGATGPLAAVLTKLSTVKKGGSFSVTGLTGQAEKALSQLGLKVKHFPDGHSEITVDGDPARAYDTLASVIAYMNAHGGTIPVYANTTYAADQIERFLSEYQSRSVGVGLQIAHANGGIDYYANGGVRSPRMDYFGSGTERHIAQIAPAGAWRVWAEPETGGEAYIPLAQSKRMRSMEILSEVANEFGVELARRDNAVRSYADGGFNEASLRSVSGGGGPTFNITNNYPQAEPTSVTVTKAGAMAANIGGV